MFKVFQDIVSKIRGYFKRGNSLFPKRISLHFWAYCRKVPGETFPAGWDSTKEDRENCVGAAAVHGVRAAEHRRKERKTVFTGLIRTIILYILIIAGIRLMGKRQVGELEPSDWCSP